jgi:hypothetical protein
MALVLTTNFLRALLLGPTSPPPPPPPPPPPTVYLLDNFVDVNGTGLDSHTMDVGPGWTDSDSVFKIESNTCQAQADGTIETASSDAGHADGVASVTLNLEHFDDAGLCCRYTDENDFIFLYIPQFDVGSGLQLWEYQFGLLNMIGQDSTFSAPVTTDFTVVLRAVGPSINASVVGTGHSCSGADTFNLSATQWGILSQFGVTPKYKNFRVTSP